jgi:hypothetical protein
MEDAGMKRAGVQIRARGNATGQVLAPWTPLGRRWDLSEEPRTHGMPVGVARACLSSSGPARGPAGANERTALKYLVHSRCTPFGKGHSVHLEP